jgi:hypothetical protein
MVDADPVARGTLVVPTGPLPQLPVSQQETHPFEEWSVSRADRGCQNGRWSRTPLAPGMSMRWAVTVMSD